MTMVYVTHDLAVLAQIADRVGVMYAGSIVEVAPVEPLFGEPRHPYTQGLIASVPQPSFTRTTGYRFTAPLRGLLRRTELGSGKSTIARAVSGLLTPERGRILFQGEPPAPGRVAARSPELRRLIQYVFQNPDASLNPRMRILGILPRSLELLGGVEPGKLDAKVAPALDEVRLDSSYAERFPDQLSGGERQRVAIARALIKVVDLLGGQREERHLGTPDSLVGKKTLAARGSPQTAVVPGSCNLRAAAGAAGHSQ